MAWAIVEISFCLHLQPSEFNYALWDTPNVSTYMYLALKKGGGGGGMN